MLNTLIKFLVYSLLLGSGKNVIESGDLSSEIAVPFWFGVPLFIIITTDENALLPW
jgi:hypothetical protein